MQTRSMTRRLNCEKAREELAMEAENMRQPAAEVMEIPTPTRFAVFMRKLFQIMRATHTILGGIGGIYAIYQLTEMYLTQPEERIDVIIIHRS